MPTEPDPVTMAEVVRRAVEICDPYAHDEAITRLAERFEDADEPVAGQLDTFDERLADAVEAVDVELDDPGVAMTVATAQYLGRRRDELEADDDTILRLAARAEWRGDPPSAVVNWLAERGVSV